MFTPPDMTRWLQKGFTAARQAVDEGAHGHS
jgi:hypothetical protein